MSASGPAVCFGEITEIGIVAALAENINKTKVGRRPLFPTASHDGSRPV